MMPCSLLTKLSIALFLMAVSMIVVDAGSAGDGFVEISNRPNGLDSITSIITSPYCVSQSMKVPNTIFTIIPSSSIDNNEVIVETYPENLMIVSVLSNQLSFQWNEGVATNTNEGGVRITVPADQLRAINVAGGMKTQVLDGFTSMESIDSSGGATLWATLQSLENSTPLTINASGGAVVNVQTTNSANTVGNVSGGAKVYITTLTFDNFNVSGGAQVYVNGNIGDGNVSGGATLTASGSSTGTIDASGGGTVLASNCNGVSTSGGANCRAGTYSVSVDTLEQPLTLFGVHQCGYTGPACIGGSNYVYSCTKQMFVKVKDIKIGESIHTANSSDDNNSSNSSSDGFVCSDVYYVYHHAEEVIKNERQENKYYDNNDHHHQQRYTTTALQFHVTEVVADVDDSAHNTASSSSMIITVSYNHIMYSGNSFHSRQPVLSQNIEIGDKLVSTAKGNNNNKRHVLLHVHKIEHIDNSNNNDTNDDLLLVNLLTINPHLILYHHQDQISTADNDSNIENIIAVIISAYSFDETLYGMLFAPIKYMYLTLGSEAIKFMYPLFCALDLSIISQFLMPKIIEYYV